MRARRIETLGKGLREMARLLNIAPAHLTDIEMGRRTPSEELMLKLGEAYGIDEAALRAGWGRAQAVVDEVANRSEVNAAKVPELLRKAGNFGPNEWDQVIRYVDKLKAKRSKGRG
ncbi:MAG: helix-turn-helix domain-containing protein [Phycisphaerales bacterium]